MGKLGIIFLHLKFQIQHCIVIKKSSTITLRELSKEENLETTKPNIEDNGWLYKTKIQITYTLFIKKINKVSLLTE